MIETNDTDYKIIITNTIIRETLERLFEYYELGSGNSVKSMLSFVFLRSRARRTRNKDLLGRYNMVLKLTYPELYEGFKL